MFPVILSLYLGDILAPFISVLTYFIHLSCDCSPGVLCWPKNSSGATYCLGNECILGWKTDSHLESSFHFHLLHVACTCLVESPCRIIATYSNLLSCTQLIWIFGLLLWMYLGCDIPNLGKFRFTIWVSYCCKNITDRGKTSTMTGTTDIRKNYKRWHTFCYWQDIKISSSGIVYRKAVHSRISIQHFIISLTC